MRASFDDARDYHISGEKKLRERRAIKRRINTLLASDLVEEKSYAGT
jgi:hypothetical protein